MKAIKIYSQKSHLFYLFISVSTLLFCVNHLVASQAIPQADLAANRQESEKWNFIVYIAGNNNLHKFTLRTIKQMVAVGSTDNINLLVQLDQWGHRKITRYHIQKDCAQVVNTFDATPQTASGTPQSLYDCVKWGVTNYKADKTALILWNHGSGIGDPHIWGRLINTDRDDLYYFNPETCMLELDRDVIFSRHFYQKGIAFNDTFETYLSNQELKETLDKISVELLGGKKIDLLGMDACHMAMLEIGTQVKSAVQYMVASQEIEPGPGWNYIPFLEEMKTKKPTAIELAKSIVNAYKTEYTNITPDYTQSAFDLGVIDPLEKNVSTLSSLLINLMNMKNGEQVVNLIKKIRTNNHFTTAFYNYNYIDLHHFYVSMLSNLDEGSLKDDMAAYASPLREQLVAGLALMSKFVIANVSGPSLKNAFGVSIYFPPRTIHNSYLRTVFAQTNSWIDFVAAYLKRVGRLDTQEEAEVITSPEGSRKNDHPTHKGEEPYVSTKKSYKKLHKPPTSPVKWFKLWR